jgi:vanillate O-demethylase monooxygenase subunit
VAAGRAEIADKLVHRKLLGESVVLYRRKDGRPVALRDWCPHRGFPLSKGTLTDDIIRCGYHGIAFDSSGACVHIPTQKAIPQQMRARGFPLVEKWLWIWIWMGDPEKADPALIPTTGFENDTLHNSFALCFPIAGSFQLLHENLLDATHVSYLHPGIIDNEDQGEVSITAAKLETKGSFVRNSRTIRNFIPSKAVARTFCLDEGAPVDRYFATEHYLPSFVLIVNRFTDPADPSRIVSLQLGHIPVTPIDEKSTYHFLGFSTSYPSGSVDDVDFFRVVIEQDAVAVAGCQDYYEQSGEGFSEISVKADQAAVSSRRIIAEMVAAEIDE